MQQQITTLPLAWETSEEAFHVELLQHNIMLSVVWLLTVDWVVSDTLTCLTRQRMPL